jgi:steroid 5-alpha reductase family enzyme
MFDISAYLAGCTVSLSAALLAWIYSLYRSNVNIVDSLWSIMFLLITLTYFIAAETLGWRASLIMVLCMIWSIRLSVYLTWRNWGQAEDRRYQAIRHNNSPRFGWKSLYIIFGLQAILACIISLPLPVAMAYDKSFNFIDALGIFFWLIGMAFEGIADWQLARFKSDPANLGQVLNRGLWRYSRHPNYFGEACVWWGFYLLAVAAGAWWTLPAPIIMTVLLLKISGVSLLEKDIAERRPAYRDYIRQTNAFLPGPIHNTGDDLVTTEVVQ